MGAYIGEGNEKKGVYVIFWFYLIEEKTKTFISIYCYWIFFVVWTQKNL